MALNTDYIFRGTCLFLALFVAVNLTGCCGRKKKIENKPKNKIDVSESIKKLKKNADKNAKNIQDTKVDDIDVDLAGSLPLSEKDNHTSELYENLERANSLYKSRNYEGALRELGRIQREIDNDPYLEMQTWMMAAMIYEKTGKTSRRKRAYDKMLSVVDTLYKDKRYIKARKDGQTCIELIEEVKKRGEKMYGED